MTKKTVFAALLILLSLNVFPQFNKGDKMVGASVTGANFTSGNTDFSFPGSALGYEAKSNSFALNVIPSYGWFIKENTAVGITLNAGISNSKVSNIQNGTTYTQNKSSQFNAAVGGFIRNFFKSKSSTMLPFVQGNLNFGTGSGTSDGFLFSSDLAGSFKETYTGKSSGIAFLNATLSFGVTKMINKHTGLDIYAGYTYSYNKKTSKTTTSRAYTSGGGAGFTSVYEPTEKYTGHGFSLGVGFQIFLDKKK